MHPQLQELDTQLLGLSDRVRTSFGSLDDAAFRARPSPDRWSAAECIAHLTITTEAFLPLLTRAFQDVSPAPAKPGGRFRRGLVGWLLERSLEPPVRFRYPTAPAFVPRADAPAAEILAAFQRSQDQLRRFVRDAEGRPLSQIRVQSPFNAKMSYNVYAAFRILAAHQRRHLWQADRALRARAADQ